MVGHSTRRRFVAAVVIALAGCTSATNRDTSRKPTATSTTTVPNNPTIGDVEQMGDLQLTSPAFEDGDSIPETYGHDAANLNPPLSIENVPRETASLVLILDDPDSVEPAGHVWLHWLVWNVPPSQTRIPEDWSPEAAVEGRNDFGERGYGGPAPPDEPHTYRFKCYALATELDLPRSAGKREVGAAMRGHRLSQTQLNGTYAP